MSTRSGMYQAAQMGGPMTQMNSDMEELRAELAAAYDANRKVRLRRSWAALA